MDVDYAMLNGTIIGLDPDATFSPIGSSYNILPCCNNTYQMKYLLTLWLSGSLLLCQAQRFTAGVVSGTGFSDFHGNFTSGKWVTKPSTLMGLFVKYSLTPVLGFETGFDYTTQYYQYKDYAYAGTLYYPDPLASFRYNGVYYPQFAQEQQWDYSFLRVPFFLTLSTPTKLRLSVSAGIYFARTVHHEYLVQGISYPQYLDSWYPYYGAPETPKYDNGMAYAASLSYPAGDHWRFQVSGRYFIGHKAFIEPYGGRTGTTELNLGVSYAGLFRSNQQSSRDAQKDMARDRFLVIPIMGVSFSHIISSQHTPGFSSRESITAGLWLEYRLDPVLSVISGVNFQRRGYRMDDSSSLFYRHGPSYLPKNEVKTRIDLDYAVIPILFKIHTGPPVDFYFLAGPYIGMLLNARTIGTAVYENSYTGGFIRNEVTVYDDIEGYVRSNDFGWIFGGGLQLPLHNGCIINAGVQYDAGTQNILSDAVANQSANTDADQVLKNRSLNILLGIAFPIH
jgi:hypothetical protein